MGARDYMRVVRDFQEPVVGHFARKDRPEDHECTSTYCKKYLNRNGVAFTTVRHARAYTAPEIAAEARISGKLLAKTVR
jgi:hypothetical protein